MLIIFLISVPVISESEETEFRIGEDYTINKSSLFISDDCKEHAVRVKVYDVSKQTPVLEEIFKSLIILGNMSPLSDSVKFELNGTRFKNCTNLSLGLRLFCTDSNEVELEPWTIEGLEIPKENISGLHCRAKGFLDYFKFSQSSLRLNSSCFTTAGLGCENDGMAEMLVGGSAGGIMLAVACLAVITGLLFYKRRDHVEYAVKTDVSPQHIIIRKSEEGGEVEKVEGVQYVMENISRSGETLRLCLEVPGREDVCRVRSEDTNTLQHSLCRNVRVHLLQLQPQPQQPQQHQPQQHQPVQHQPLERQLQKQL